MHISMQHIMEFLISIAVIVAPGATWLGQQHLRPSTGRCNHYKRHCTLFAYIAWWATRMQPVSVLGNWSSMACLDIGNSNARSNASKIIYSN